MNVKKPAKVADSRKEGKAFNLIVVGESRANTLVLRQNAIIVD